MVFLGPQHSLTLVSVMIQSNQPPMSTSLLNITPDLPSDRMAAVVEGTIDVVVGVAVDVDSGVVVPSLTVVEGGIVEAVTASTVKINELNLIIPKNKLQLKVNRLHFHVIQVSFVLENQTKYTWCVAGTHEHTAHDNVCVSCCGRQSYHNSVS